MKPWTISAIAAIVQADPPASESEWDRVMDAVSAFRPERKGIVRTRKAAELMGVSRRTLHTLSRQGVLQPVKLPNRKVALGYRLQEIEQLAEGR